MSITVVNFERQWSEPLILSHQLVGEQDVDDAILDGEVIAPYETAPVFLASSGGRRSLATSPSTSLAQLVQIFALCPSASGADWRASEVVLRHYRFREKEKRR